MRRADMVLQMQKAGMNKEEIAHSLGIKVSSVKNYSWTARNWERKRARAERLRRSRGVRPITDIVREDKVRATIIAAVDAGLSYAAVARKFGLKSRNVVAGIVSRRPESRGVGR